MIRLPEDAKFSSLREVSEAVSACYQDALADAKRCCGRGSFYSRGKALRIVKGGDVIAGEAESWQWDGKLDSLVKAVEEAKQLGADLLSIEGGVDYALNPRDYSDGSYDPWVGEWEVVVWAAPEPDKPAPMVDNQS